MDGLELIELNNYHENIANLSLYTLQISRIRVTLSK